jgi:DNA-binding response OmpR family regulator
MKVLIVEDEEKLAEALKSGLKYEGFTVDILGDGLRGENRILMCRGDYDVIILDLMLPGKNGFEICKTVRSKGVTLPIIILTARDGTDDKILALNSGADDYLVKPFAFGELLARIRALLRRPRESLPGTLQLGDLVLNPTTREVTRDEKHIDLTLKEFELLQYLMRHPNQVMGREDIFAHLWDFADSSLSNVIDAHIKNLRKKIDEGFPKKLLETIRGVGYTIKE